MAAILAAKSVSKQFAAVYGRAEFQLKLGAAHGLHVCRRDAAAFGILPLFALCAANDRPACAGAG